MFGMNNDLSMLRFTNVNMIFELSLRKTIKTSSKTDRTKAVFP